MKGIFRPKKENEWWCANGASTHLDTQNDLNTYYQSKINDLNAERLTAPIDTGANKVNSVSFPIVITLLVLLGLFWACCSLALESRLGTNNIVACLAICLGFGVRWLLATGGFG